jgi:hypothetical protein
MSEMQRYKERSFRFVELLSIHDWRMKLYGIAWQGELPRPELLEAAKCIAAETLAKETANNYKVGFVGAHDGRNASFVFVDFWGNENELFHRVFLSRSNDPSALTTAKSSDSSVCVWDLRLQSFEREAWIKHILRKANAPDFDGYLAERLNEDA